MPEVAATSVKASYRDGYIYVTTEPANANTGFSFRGVVPVDGKIKYALSPGKYEMTVTEGVTGGEFEVSNQYFAIGLILASISLVVLLSIGFIGGNGDGAEPKRNPLKALKADVKKAVLDGTVAAGMALQNESSSLREAQKSVRQRAQRVRQRVQQFASV